MSVTVRPAPPNVNIVGNVLFETVPFGATGQGLNYSGRSFLAVNGVLVEVVNAATQAVIASSREAGSFLFSVPSQTDMALRVTAELRRQAPDPLPHWQISVRDLDANGAPIGPVYSYTGPVFNSGSGGNRSLQIPSGWDTAGQPAGPRHAAPFAILTSISKGLAGVRTAAPIADFPPLTIDWSPTNVGGQTFFTTGPNGRRIVLGGEANVDTDEYDEQVILHEFGHYVATSFARDDNIGGPHSLGDRLDMRIAFGEGLATALAGMFAGNPLYRDSFGLRQGNDGFFDIENDQSTDGWFSEFSTHEILWDLYDGLSDGSDSVTVDFTTIWNVLVTSLRQSDAMTSVFPYFTALKQSRPDIAANINALLAAEQIVGATVDAYGSTETNNAGGLPNVLPVYTNIALGNSVQLTSTNQSGRQNKLSNHRFLRFSVPATTNVRFQVTAAAGKDPDLEIFRRGVSIGPDQGPADENFPMVLDAGDYVLDVYDCGNADCNPNVIPGPTDITVSVTPN